MSENRSGVPMVEVNLDDLVGAGNDVYGLDIGTAAMGWTGNAHRLTPAPAGKGLRIIGDGHVIRTLEGVSFIHAPGSGPVELVGARVVTGYWKGIQLGVEGIAAHPDDKLLLTGVTIEGEQGKWALHGRNGDLDAEDIVVDTLTGEHDFYLGNPARDGWVIRKAKFKRSHDECCKVVNRLFEGLRYVRGRLVIEDASFNNFGSAIVIQGAGADVHLRRISIEGQKDGYTDPCIRIDDGLSPNRLPGYLTGQYRYSDHRGVPEGPGAANGRCLIEDVAVWGEREIVRIGKEIPQNGETWDHYVVQALEMRRCGFFGPNSFVNVHRELTLGSHRVHDNNNDPVTRWCSAALGWDVSHPAAIYAD